MKTPTETGFRRMAGGGALLAALAVGLGAFGAHALREALAPAMLGVYETAARYQMYHALGLVAAACAGLAGWADRRRAWWACVLFVSGTLLFSGSLYALALTGAAAFGAVTPAGGLAFLAAWVLLALSFLRTPR
ncbi:MAG TPA: DUF423 domain-containing protein [Bacteroidota bacterium]|nr:DUF423 domain-containing protein [Bacteroidota bacterium]